MKRIVRLIALALALALLPSVSAVAESVPTLALTADGLSLISESAVCSDLSVLLELGFETNAVSAVLSLSQEGASPVSGGLRLENGTLAVGLDGSGECLALDIADSGKLDAFKNGVETARAAVELARAVRESDSLDLTGWLSDTFEGGDGLLTLSVTADELPDLIASFLSADKAAAAAWDKLAAGLGDPADAALDALLSLSQDGFELEGTLTANGEERALSATGLTDGSSYLLDVSLDDGSALSLAVPLNGEGTLDIAADMGLTAFSASLDSAVGVADGPLWLPDGAPADFEQGIAGLLESFDFN